VSLELIVEPHPETYNGYPFITLIEFKGEPFVTIIDNYHGKSIKTLVLDYCNAENVDEEMIITIAEQWYTHSSSKYPVSFEFSKRDLTSQISPIYRTFNTEFISRVIGPVPVFNMDKVSKVQRRKRKIISPNIEIVKKGFVSNKPFKLF
jgi:hypothetical protein